MGQVARWEFLRYVKPRQQAVSLVVTFVFLMGGAWLGRLAAGRSTVELAVLGAEHLPTLADDAGRFRFVRHETADEARLRSAVETREVRGLVVLRPGGEGELVARQDPAWRADLERELSAAVRMHRLATSGLDPAELAALQAPFELGLREVSPRAGPAERWAAIIALALAMVGLFSGISYIFSSVTGEKQNRLSEQIVSSIPAQAWIDGKILGLSAVSMVVVLNTVAAGLLFLVANRAVAGPTFPLPTTVERPELLLAALLLILLGYLFWFAFLVAVAALVDDPHTSARNQLIFLPILASFPAFLAISDPGATWARALALLPPTSAGVMPARLLVTDVPWWEVAVAALLLVALGLAVRRAAGKVFRLAMLMYGKEATWAEVRRWVREA